MRSKHNKKRNTAFIYEALVRQLTKAFMKEDYEQKSIILSILEEHFKKNTCVAKELQLYNTLRLERKMPPEDAKMVLSESKRQYDLIDRKKLFEEQNEIVSKINKKLGKHTFQNFVPNYKELATIYQIFNGYGSPTKRVELEKRILENLQTHPEERGEQAPIGKLAFKTFVSKFNSTYGSLLSEQKELLNKFVTSFEDDNLELKIYLNEEIGRLKEVIMKSMSIKELQEDSTMKEKAEKVIQLMNSFSENRIDEALIEQVLKIQELAKEMNENGD